MKWIKPEPGTKRYREKFLFFPKTIGDETRWLELAHWVETYEWRGINTYGNNLYRWQNTKWISFSEYYWKGKTIKEVAEETYGRTGGGLDE